MRLSSLQWNESYFEKSLVIIQWGWGVLQERAKKKKFVKLTSDRETTKAPLGLELLSLADGGLGRENNGVENEAILVSLDLADHLGLGLGGAVVVDDTETTEQGHVNGHVVLGDGVHGRGQKRSLQGDTLGDRGIKRHIGGGEAWTN